MTHPYPLRDMQDEPPAGYCARCGGELYGVEAVDGLCPECKEEEGYERSDPGGAAAGH